VGTKCDNPRVLFPFSLILFGAIGWVASFGLTLERIKVAGDPAAATACDISPFISCKSVMLSEQAELFGFPNPLLGLAAYFAPILVGFAIIAGAKFASWFWQLLLVGHVLGMAFVFWLFSQSVYVIGSLCIYCMVAWAATIPLFWAIFGKAGSEGHLGARLVKVGQVSYEWTWVLVLLTYIGLVIPILIHFWDYWPTLF